MKLIAALVLVFTLLHTRAASYPITALPAHSLSGSGKQWDQDSLPSTKTAFMETYGTDDTSRALIRFYYHKQKNFRAKKVLVFITLGMGLFFIFVAIANRHDHPAWQTDSDPQPGVAGGLMAGGAIASGIVSFTRHGRFRAKLAYELKDYQKTRYVNPGITRSTLFRLCLKGEPREQYKLYKQEIRAHRWRRNKVQ